MNPFDKISLVREFSGIPSSQKSILLNIATHLGKNDFAFLSLSTLQKECCLTRGNVSKNLKKLIDKELIIKMPPSQKYRSNQYSINFDALTGTETLLAPKDYQNSNKTLLNQSCNITTSVAKQYPKENKEKEKNTKKSINNRQETRRTIKEWTGDSIKKLTPQQKENGQRHVRDIIKGLKEIK